MKKFVKAILLSVAALAAGYLAISLPFNLFNTMSDRAMQGIFLGELIIYFVISLIFLVAHQRKKEEKMKAARRHLARREKIARVQSEWYDLAA